MPPSDTVGVAERLTVVTLIVSGTVVLATAVLNTRLSKVVPPEIAVMLRLVEEGADAVVGSRYVPGGGTVNWPIHRRLLSKWGNRYTGFVLGMKVRDCTSGFRAYRATTLRSADPGSTAAEGYAFLTELVRRLAVQGAQVVETPILFKDREAGTSKMSGRIVVESMLLVTRWGLADRWRTLRSRRRR